MAGIVIWALGFVGNGEHGGIEGHAFYILPPTPHTVLGTN